MTAFSSLVLGGQPVSLPPHTPFQPPAVVAMSSEEDWDELLRNHPVFTLPKRVTGAGWKGEASLNLSLSSLPDFVDLDPVDDKPTPSGRRQAIAIKDADLIVAVGSEIRIASLGDSKGARGTSQKSYKVCIVAYRHPSTLLNLTGPRRFCTLPMFSLRSIRLL